MIRSLITLSLTMAMAQALPESLTRFSQQAETTHGPIGASAAKFLIAHMPEADRANLSTEYLIENLNLAFKARETFTWAKDIPEEVFFNDVLPYAVFDEARDPWRADFLQKATPIVTGATTASEAAQRLNQQFFKLINTHYHTGRKLTNQSPKESMEQGKATCTGLSIILVDACRAVGIPARAVGTPMWSDMRGNHTWVEIYDQGEWHFTGADEYDDKGLNRGWFIKAASMADASQVQHAIYATSWQPQGTPFPMVWSPRSREVGGVNVTERYNKLANADHQVGIRLFATNDRGSRLASKGTITRADGTKLATFTTKAGTTDLNDMPEFTLMPGTDYQAHFEVDGQTLESDIFLLAVGTTTLDFHLDELKPFATPIADQAIEGLTQKQAEDAIDVIYRELVGKQAGARSNELKQKSITIGEHTLKWLEKTFGDAPADGRSLWISMHGGGQAPERVNTQQWQNQIRLYQPKEGIYVAPRAPTDTWNMWHQAHIDPLFSRLIEDMVALRGVNPNKIYLMGYSAGGDGVWQVAPRMADRYAAASMMAGHPNEAQLDGLRNLPFGIFCGSEDRAVNRNKVCAERMQQIQELAKADPGGYVNMTRLYKGFGHWMKLQDAESLPWMASFTRKPWPEKIVWLQDDVTHDRFYWLEVPADAAEKGKRIEAEVKDQWIRLKGDVPSGTRLLLNDKLLKLDQEIKVIVNDGKPTTYKPQRSAKVIREALEKRLDPASAPTACIVLE